MTVKEYDKNSRGDMYLPGWILGLGCVLCIAGGYWLLQCVIRGNGATLIGAAGSLGLGISAVLCWKNQKIQMISGTHFEYTTFLGNRYTYAFTDITGIELGRGGDHWTLHVAGKKVHMESCAVISARLLHRISKELTCRNPETTI